MTKDNKLSWRTIHFLNLECSLIKSHGMATTLLSTDFCCSSCLSLYAKKLGRKQCPDQEMTINKDLFIVLNPNDT